MSANDFTVASSEREDLPWHVVPGVKTLHVRDCPHLTAQRLAQLRLATAGEIAAYVECKSCLSIRGGARRVYYTSFEAAMEDLPVPVENRPRMREIASTLSLARIWIPSSKQYIAVAPGAGDNAEGYFNRSFVDLRAPEGGYTREEMPNAAATRSGSRSPSRHEEPGHCPDCHLQLPATGACDDCA